MGLEVHMDKVAWAFIGANIACCLMALSAKDYWQVVFNATVAVALIIIDSK